jgi:hypothetical protein
MKFSVTVLVLCVSLPCFGAGSIQKWVDKDGKVHYGDPATAQVIPDAPPRKATDAATLNKPKPMDSQTWNKAVEKAESAPAGAGGRHLGTFVGPDPVDPRGGSDYLRDRRRPQPPSNPRSYGPSPHDALRHADAERQLSAQRKQQQLAQDDRKRQLMAECERQRTSDCQNPNTLQYMENANKPRGAYR